MNALRLAPVSVLATCSLLVAPDIAFTQDVQYQTVTRVELPGAAGTAMRLATRLGGGSTETLETTYIKGNKMRIDAERSSTILDLDERRFISIDHAAKTYGVLTFDELLRKAHEASAESRQNTRQVNGSDNAEAQFNFRFSVAQGGERQPIAGYDAERFFLTMEAEGEYAADGAAEREKAGTLVVLTDMWTTKDIPVFRARSAFEDASARQYADAGSALMQGIAAAFADDPRMKVAFEQSVNEARKIDGMAVRTVTSFVSVAPGQQFNRALVTEPTAPRESTAKQMGRAALGRLSSGIMGRAGRRQEPARPEASETEATQATVLTVTSEIRDVSTKALDATLFQIPAGYSELKSER